MLLYTVQGVEVDVARATQTHTMSLSCLQYAFDTRHVGVHSSDVNKADNATGGEQLPLSSRMDGGAELQSTSRLRSLGVVRHCCAHAFSLTEHSLFDSSVIMLTPIIASGRPGRHHVT